MIDDDWTLTQIVLQILTEEGLGNRLREAKAAEEAQYRATSSAIRNG